MDSIVIGGAGIRNYASLGAISKLSKILPNVKNFLGVSSGSILATLLAIGCSSEEVEKYYTMLNLSQFKIKYESLYTYYKIYKYGGIYDSKIFREEIVYKILNEKTGNGNITFLEIYEKYGKVLVIPAACINKREMFYYNYITNPNLSVKFAIERSCCIPGLFFPIRYKGDTLVDGGVIDNYPLYYFNNVEHLPNSRTSRVIPTKEKISEKTFGILIIDDKVSKDQDDPYLGDDSTLTFIEYLKAILNTILTTGSRSRISTGYWESTIAIDIKIDVDSVSDMVLSEETKKILFQAGSDEAEKFISKLKLYDQSPI